MSVVAPVRGAQADGRSTEWVILAAGTVDLISPIPGRPPSRRWISVLTDRLTEGRCSFRPSSPPGFVLASTQLGR